MVLAGATLLALTLAACGDDSDAGTPADTTAPAAVDTSAPQGSDSTTPATGATTCAPADGSAPKQQIFSAMPPMCLEDGKAYTAVIETSKGTLHVALRPDIAPQTVNSFVNLARYHYFDATTCHRAIQGFVVQCGDPTATGTGGPGYEIPDEFDKIEPYQIGSIAMANTVRPNTGGSQFFIITGPNGQALPPQYTLFGQVAAEDLPVVQALDAISNPNDGPPLEPIDITSITITES